MKTDSTVLRYRATLATNLKSELVFLLAILEGDIVLKSFLDKINQYVMLPIEAFTEEVWNECVDVQLAIHDFADTIVNIDDLNYHHTFHGTSMFSVLWHTSNPMKCECGKYCITVSKNFICDSVDGTLNDVLEDKPYSLAFTVLKR